MADTRHIQTLDQIRDAIGFPSGAANPSGMTALLGYLNTTASLMLPGIGQTASNVSAAAGQLATLNTTASHIDGRLAGTRFAHPRPDEFIIAQVSNPAAGNNTLQGAPLGSFANILHKIKMQFVASHQTGKTIAFRDGTTGSSWFTTLVPPGNFNWEVDLPSPKSQTQATAAVCFVATGFSAIGTYETMLTQLVPATA